MWLGLSARERRDTRPRTIAFGGAATRAPPHGNRRRAGLAQQPRRRQPVIDVFAHNTHVQNAPTEGGIWANLERPPEAMGQHLRAALGKDLFILGTASDIASRGTQAAGTNPDTVEAPLESLNLPVFVLDLRSAPRGEVTAWLAERRTLNAASATEIVSPGQAFDALVFIRTMSPARTEQSRP